MLNRVGRILTSSPLQSPPPTVALMATSNCLTQPRKLWLPSPGKCAGRSTLTSLPGEHLPNIPELGLKGSSSPHHMSVTQLLSVSKALHKC